MACDVKEGELDVKDKEGEFCILEGKYSDDGIYNTEEENDKSTQKSVDRCKRKNSFWEQLRQIQEES